MQSGKNPINNKGFTNEALFPHTDRSPLPNPPDYLLNWVIKEPEKEGEILLVPGDKVYRSLQADHPETAKKLLQTEVAFFDGYHKYVDTIIQEKCGHSFFRFRLDNCINYPPSLNQDICVLKAVIEQHIISINPTKGFAYLIDNQRWLHGRNAFQGERIIGRIHIKKGNTLC